MPCLHCHCDVIHGNILTEHHVNLNRVTSANIGYNSASKMAYNGCFTCSVRNEHGRIDHVLEAGAMFGHATKPWSIPLAISHMHLKDPSSRLSSPINPLLMCAPLIILSHYWATLFHWGQLTHKCQWNIPTLLQIMAWRLFSTKPLSEPMLPYYQLELKEHFSVKLCLKFRSFHSRKCTWKCRLQNDGHFV